MAGRRFPTGRLHDDQPTQGRGGFAGGGPQVATAEDGTSATIRDNAAVAKGAELYRLNCASCHNFTGKGGALSSGKIAPALDPATEDEIYAAMLTGPQNMPKFSDRQLTPDEKEDIIAYIKSVSGSNNNPGGNPLGGIGPGISWPPRA